MWRETLERSGRLHDISAALDRLKRIGVRRVCWLRPNEEARPRTYVLTYLLTCLLAYLLTYSLTHSLTHLLTYLLWLLAASQRGALPPYTPDTVLGLPLPRCTAACVALLPAATQASASMAPLLMATRPKAGDAA